MAAEGWFVTRTECRREITAATSIAKAGFLVYFPLRTVEVRHARKLTEETRPLFPRYVFAHGVLANAGKVNFCRGAIRRGLIVDSNGNASVVSERIIDGIKRREEALRRRPKHDGSSGYIAGEIIRIERGPYASFDVQYIGEENGKAMVLAQLFGSGRLATIDIGDLPRCPRHDMEAA